MKKLLIGMSLLAVMFVSGCWGIVSRSSESVNSEKEIAESVDATLTAIAEDPEPAPTLGPTPSHTPISPVWLEDPERFEGLTLPDVLAGLTYASDAVWLVDRSGISRMLMGQPANGVVSPDGTGYLFSSQPPAGDDIMYYNIAAEKVMQFTDTPDLHEGNYRWWAERRNVIVYQYVPDDELGPWPGYLAAFDITYSETIVIDNEFGSGTGFALSSDGERIAYLQNTDPAIYTWGEGSELIDLATFGLDFEGYSSPAWSPDGKWLAFHASGGQQDGGRASAVVVLDLESNSAEILHEYISLGQRVPPELAFSPDGAWLASVNPGEVAEDGSPVTMWALALDGGEKIELGYATGPHWRPDGGYLLYTAWSGVGSTDLHEIVLAEVGRWQGERVEGLAGSFVRGWIDLP